MKTVLKLSVFASILLLIAVGCKKLMTDDNPMNTKSNKEFNAAFVKEWYYGDFIKSAEFKNYNQMKNGIKLPDWKNGKSFKIGEIEIVEFPLQASKKLIGVPNSEDKNNAPKIVAASIQKIVFVKNKNNTITIKVMQYVPTFDFLRSQNYDISNLSLKDYTKSFKGTIRILNWSGQFEKGYIFRNDRNYRLKEEIKLTDKNNIKTANKDCGGVLETWFEYECNSDYTGDVYDPNQCNITYIVSQTYTPFDCGPDIENCNEPRCMCANYGIGCDFTSNTNPAVKDCGLISNEEGRQQLNSIIGQELFDVSYTLGTRIAPDANGVTRLPKLPYWPFYKLSFVGGTGGYSPSWIAHFSGIIYKNKITEPWKWESISYVNTDRDGPLPPCFAADMSETIASPVISSNKQIATTAANYTLTISLPCLFGVEVKTFSGAIPYCELLAN